MPAEPRPPTELLGVGGLGVGVVYRLQGGRTLGREESRPARLLPIADRCKLQIILHYVAVAVRELGLPTRVLPLGLLGDDAEGRLLRRELRAAGMSTALLRTVPGVRTQTSVCFQYPDGSGGNVTDDQAAAGRLTPALVRTAAARLGPRGLAVAAPEVPLAARLALLRLARRRGARTVAAFTSSELAETDRDRALALVDLLALNMDEARALADATAGLPAERVLRRLRRRRLAIHPGVRLSVTDGRRGSWFADAGGVQHLAAVHVPAANCAGAGDAYLAGLLLAELLGLAPPEALALARAIAAFSVTAADTIHPGFSLPALRAFARRWRLRLPAALRTHPRGARP